MSSRLVKLGAAAAVALSLAACHSKNTHAQEVSPQVAAKGQAFLDKMAKQPGVQTLPSGLEFKVAHSGPADGIKPRMGDEVKVHYQGTLVDGTVFDSSYDRGEPAVFTLGEVIPAWNEALQLMRPGDVWYLYVPAKLAYGDREAGPIPPGSVLVFKVELLGVLPHGGGEAQG